MDISHELLEFLRDEEGNDDLTWSESPKRLARGAEAVVYGFQLANEPPMVLRLLDGGSHPDSAIREAEFQAAVDEAGFPAPEVYHASTDTSALGAPFVVMERLEGRSLFRLLPWAVGAWVALGALGLPLLGALGIFAMWFISARTLRQLHGVAVSAVRARLPDPERFVFRARLAELAERVRAEPRYAGLVRGIEWLEREAPDADADAAVCHGDFWLANIMVEPVRVTGVIDWSNAALAPPEYDLGWTRIQPYSRLPLAIPGEAWVEDLLWLFAYPFAWVLFSGHLWAYRLMGKLDGERLAYFTAYHALRTLVWIDEHAERAAGRWDAPRTKRQICERFERTTGVPITAPVREHA